VDFVAIADANGPLYFGLQHLNDPIKLLAVALKDDRFAAYGRSCDLLGHGETRCPERRRSAARDGERSTPLGFIASPLHCLVRPDHHHRGSKQLQR
jgi:hypothetical protein